MKRYLTFIMIMLLLILTLSGCRKRFNEDDYIGKSSVQIQEEFGKFDCTGVESPDGLYRKTNCGYTAKEAQRGYLGTEPEELFFISFDEEGIAVECFYGVRPGG